jgi:hypothetical protein
MTEIKNERDLKDFLRRKHAVLFFHASWSLYAMISKEIMEFVENHAIMQQRNVSFFFGEFRMIVFPWRRQSLQEVFLALSHSPVTGVFRSFDSVSTCLR